MSDPTPPTAGHPYRAFVEALVTATRAGQDLPLGGLGPLPRRPSVDRAATVMVLAPHPDDECITGALPLRLLRRNGAQVVAVPVTLGSNRARRAGRLAELEGACGFLGFDLMLPPPEARSADPAAWRRAADALAVLIERAQPQLLLYPHATDWNRTHMGTHLLAVDALRLLPASFSCQVAETEYWSTMPAPNLMVESTAEETADLVAAISFYVGEVQRNPFHLRLPAWMQDNVRRGGEVVGGQGVTAPDFGFATLYGVRRLHEGKLEPAYSGGRHLPAEADPGAFFSSLAS